MHWVYGQTGVTIITQKQLSENLKSVCAIWNKTTGPKPPGKEMKASTLAGYKPVTTQWVAVGMYLRKSGATQIEMTAAVGGPHLNVWRAMEKTGKAKAGTLATTAQEKRGKHFAYTVRLLGTPNK